MNLLVSHQPLIRAFVISLLPGLPEAEEVIQNTNQVLWARRDSFTLGTNFKAWALASARFQTMALQQKLHRERRLPLDDDVMDLLADYARDTGRSVAALKTGLHRIRESLRLCHERKQRLREHPA